MIHGGIGFCKRFVFSFNKCLETAPLKDNMKPYQCSAQWNTADPEKKWKRKFKGFLEEDAVGGLLGCAFTGVCSVSLK